MIRELGDQGDQGVRVIRGSGESDQLMQEDIQYVIRWLLGYQDDELLKSLQAEVPTKGCNYTSQNFVFRILSMLTWLKTTPITS